MNCADCRDDLVVYLEGLLDSEQSRQCQEHLGTCAACQAEYTAITRLRQQLIARGRAVADVSMAGPVMTRIRHAQIKPERSSIMSRLLKHRWGFGLGAAAGAAAAIVLIITLTTPNAQAKAVEIMAKGARAIAKLTAIHFRGQMRTAPQDNFSAIMPEQELIPIEVWKQFEPSLKWRVEKPARVAVMDGQSTLMLIKTANLAVKFPQPSSSAFDTEWLHRIAGLSTTITNELNNALAKGWKMNVTDERGADGATKSVVTIEAKAGLPESAYVKNKFFDAADTRRVYRFDAQSERLESVQIYLVTVSGERLVFELDQIEYNLSIPPAVFQLELPPNVHWYQNEMQKIPDNEKYATMTAEQAARAYFEAFARQDWTEAEKFRRMTVDEDTKKQVSRLEVVTIGKAFTSPGYPGSFVPYEIKLNNGETIKHNIALKKDLKTGRWFVDGGGF
jgi:hypothetical protein